jgi:hypothetical protein
MKINTNVADYEGIPSLNSIKLVALKNRGNQGH